MARRGLVRVKVRARVRSGALFAAALGFALVAITSASTAITAAPEYEVDRSALGLLFGLLGYF
jgi:hypothetical protein